MTEQPQSTTYHIIIRTSQGLPPQLIEQLIGDAFKSNGIISLYDTEMSIQSNYNDWFRAIELVSIEFSPLFIRDFVITKNPISYKLYEVLQTVLQHFDKTMATVYAGHEDLFKGINFVKYSVYANITTTYIPRFIFSANSKSENEKLAWKEMLDLLVQIETDQKVISQITSGLRLRPDKVFFLLFNEESHTWTPLNAAIERAKELSDRYRNDKDDSRVSKPRVIVNEDNYNQARTYDHQWMLQEDAFPIIMAKPNDVALYISLMRKNRTKAQTFYNEHIAVLGNSYYNPILNNKKTSEFYDYFEDVISATIFSYTAIEALANSCIPVDYKHQEEKSGITTIYSKDAIERKFSLRDKLKVVLKDILKTPDPTNQSWWNKFISLEDTRNEIIHTKQGKSEYRYGKLLEEHIFKVISISETVISFYGNFIEENAKQTLDIFPFDFGHDYVLPGFMTSKNYINMEKRSRGIPE